jgi:hypothetical protein
MEHKQGRFILSKSGHPGPILRNQEVLTWSLARHLGMQDCLIIGPLIHPSLEIADELSSKWVENELNKSNCFDFDYTPLEKDWLRISGGFGEYLSFVFLGKSWHRDKRLGLRDEFEMIHEGRVLYEKLAQRRMAK